VQETKFLICTYKEAQTQVDVFVHTSASSPGIITSQHRPSTTSGSNANQPTVFIVRYTEGLRVLENFVANMQFSLNVLAILVASASVVSATQPRRYAPQAYQPVQYGNTVSWTSSTCSAVYSTIMQTSTKPVQAVVTTTTYKPSTWTSTRPTVITSVYTTFKPATTTAISTVISVYTVK
jgi:hypothetical protein